MKFWELLEHCTDDDVACFKVVVHRWSEGWEDVVDVDVENVEIDHKNKTVRLT